MSGNKKKNCQNIKVYVRQRPLNKDETESKVANIVQKITSKEICIKSGYTEKRYNFDHVFGEELSQIDVYNVVVSPLISHVVSGFNCTVFAYGQTGTGKTYTIVGESPNNYNMNFYIDSSIGLIPRAAAQLFSELRKLNLKSEYTVRVSCIEVYNEEVRDLLCDSTPLRVYDDSENKGSVYLKGLREVTVCNVQEVYEWLNIAIMERQTASTDMNTRSSRSHMLFTMLINTREITSDGEELIKTGKLNLVDLGGSENIGKSGAVNVRVREAATINKSISTLGMVIKALSKKMQYIPYRESKLTRILQDSLGGYTKTSMIATISPGAHAWDETVNTLECAHITRSIANSPQVNICRKHTNLLNEFQNEISKLQSELAAARSKSGFYVNSETYEKMTQDIQKNKERMLDLLQKICDLEEYERVKEEQYEQLNKSFEQTKLYLESAKHELELKNKKGKENEDTLNYLIEKDEELSKTASALLNICEVSTKREEIFHSKYERQCNATLSNADIVKKVASTSVKCLQEIQNFSEVHKSKEEDCIKEIRKCTEHLQENGIVNLEPVKQVTLAMQSHADNYKDLTTEQVLTRDTADFRENNIVNYFNTLSDDNLLQFKEEKMKHSLKELKNHLVTKNAETEQKANICLDLIDDSLIQKEDYFMKTENMLKNVHEICCKRIQNLENQKNEKKKIRSLIKEHLAILEQERNTLLEEVVSLKQIMEDIRQIARTHESKQLSTQIHNTSVDYQKCQLDFLTAQISMIEDIITINNENRERTQHQTATNKSKVEQYLLELTETVKQNLNQHNEKLMDVFYNWVQKVNAAKDRFFEAATHSSKIIDRNINLISESNIIYKSNVQKIVEQTSQEIEDMEKNIIVTTHAGDTPVKITYNFPKSKNMLSEQMKQITEEDF